MAAGSRCLWLIDGAYLFNARQSVSPGFHYDYLKLRQKLESNASIWRAYYLNSTPDPWTDAQDSFHTWLKSAPPRGPKIITKLYQLKDIQADKAYCIQCGSKVKLECPAGGNHKLLTHNQRIMPNEQPRGKFVGSICGNPWPWLLAGYPHVSPNHQRTIEVITCRLQQSW